MAKRGRRPRRRFKKPVASLQTLVKKPEMWVGVFTVGVLLGIITGIIFRNQSKLGFNQKKETSIISPVPTETVPSAVIEITTSPAVKRLASTSSSLEIIVQANDSYWEIAQRVCRNAKKNFLTIQDLNGNIKLYKGMVVKVICE